MIDIKDKYTIGFLGCGTMGTAVLNAVLNGLDDKSAPIKPGTFVAGVRSEGSAHRLRGQFPSIDVVADGNAKLVDQADIIVLGCKPFMAEEILNELPKGLFENKIVISLLAGKTIADLTDLTHPTALIARAMTNTPSKIGAGMTVVSLPKDAAFSADVRTAIDWIFSQTGRCLFLDEKHQDVCTALCGSGPAFLYLVMEAMCDGAVRMGLPYALAQECAAQVLVGSGQMVLDGGHPAVLRSSVCTPGGTTIGGLLVMEDNRVRSAVARAIEESTNIATALGKKK